MPRSGDSAAAQPPVDPIPVPPDARRILLFGGTFDPVHKAHHRIAIESRDRVLGSDAWLVLVPAAQSPFKARQPVASNGDRLAMLHAAFDSAPRTAIWATEFERPPPSYWIETVRSAAASLAAGSDLRFLIGADAAAEFRHWREWSRILTLAKPVVVPRAPLLTAAALRERLLDRGWAGVEADNLAQQFVEIEPWSASSTRVREWLETGDPRAAAALDPAVLAVIHARGLYRATGRAGPPLPATDPEP